MKIFFMITANDPKNNIKKMIKTIFVTFYKISLILSLLFTFDGFVLQEKTKTKRKPNVFFLR